MGDRVCVGWSGGKRLKSDFLKGYTGFLEDGVGFCKGRVVFLRMIKNKQDQSSKPKLVSEWVIWDEVVCRAAEAELPKTTPKSTTVWCK